MHGRLGAWAPRLHAYATGYTVHCTTIKIVVAAFSPLKCRSLSALRRIATPLVLCVGTQTRQSKLYIVSDVTGTCYR